MWTADLTHMVRWHWRRRNFFGRNIITTVPPSADKDNYGYRMRDPQTACASASEYLLGWWNNWIRKKSLVASNGINCSDGCGELPTGCVYYLILCHFAWLVGTDGNCRSRATWWQFQWKTNIQQRMVRGEDVDADDECGEEVAISSV